MNGETIKPGTFKVGKVGGYRAVSPIIKKSGRDFYAFNGPVHFNLPPGEYTTNTELTPCKPVKYRVKSERKRERFDLKAPKKIQVKFADNPNKASIHLAEGYVILDNKYKEAPECMLKYILYHEIGHYFYTTESFCDEYATERLLEEGYNQSQIIWASEKSLGPDNVRHLSCKIKVKEAIK